jgi:Fe-S-cluster containining protein
MGKLERGRCGLCCTLLVRLAKEDIARIRKLGHKESCFVARDSSNSAILNRTNGYCRFLEIKEGIATCTIYESRPKVCREYDCIGPGETECRLQRHYSVADFSKIGGSKR